MTSFKANRTNISLFGVGLLLSLSACGPIATPKIDLEMPVLPDPLASFSTCEKGESDLPAVSADVQAKKMVVEDRIETKNLETIGCDGQVTSTKRGPERDLDKYILVDAPAGLTEAVGYVSVENTRTCATHIFDARDSSSVGGDTITLPDGKTLTTPFAGSSAMRSGRMAIDLTDSKLKLNVHLNVKEGLNVLKVRYFAKCTDLKPESERMPFAAADSYLNCSKGRELLNQDLLVEVKVDRPESDGTKQLKAACPKKEVPAEATPVETAPATTPEAAP